ncbi:MAG: AAA family ATPase, partial [Betaproteobacteria bacterium]
MYSQHFGLTQDPFSIAPDPRFLFMSERHREALAHLLYGVTGSGGAVGGTGGGFVLLTGDIGTGKTTICRCFLEQIPRGCHVAYIFNPKLTVAELLQSICQEFHVALAPSASNAPTVKDYIDALNAFLLQSHGAGQSSVLIIDEAQNLAADVLEQLRLLTNLETNERKLLQIVLIGQPELRAMLERPELEQLAQRVIARFHLEALTDAESTQYIRHRLAVAGHSGALPFESKSLRLIHRLAQGVPRRINLLCGRALLGAWANGLERVDRRVVDKAAAEVFGSESSRAVGVASGAYALGSLALLAVAALVAWLAWSQPQAAVPAAAPVAQPTAALAPPALAVPRPLEELDSLLERMPGDLNQAWRELASAWKLDVGSADPCQTSAAQPLQCYRSSKLTLPLLRQLGRPVILTLQSGNGAPVYAQLVG